METIDMLKTAGLSSTGILVILIAYRVFKTMNGHRIVSTCCGKKMDVGFAVEPITPEPPRKEATADDAVVVEVKNPITHDREKTDVADV